MDETTQTQRTQENDERIVWQAPEHGEQRRGADWYIIVGIVSLAITLSALIYGNILFAVLIVVATFSLVLFAVRKPPTVTFSLSSQGLAIGEQKYPYTILDSFWISEPEGEGEDARLILQSEKLFVHHITVPLKGVDADEVREYLLDYLPEEEEYEPLSHQIMEYLGF